MGRRLRYVPEGGALVEVTNRTTQGRYLLRPDGEGRLNEVVVGVVGRAQRLYSMPVIGISVLSNHFHMLLYPRDAEHLALFMCHVDGNLSQEIGRLHDWPGTLWDDRYHGIVVSDEERAQVDRLRYLLANGTKELLVDRPEDWPGVHSVRALRDGEPLCGVWFDRTKESAARRRGEDPEPYEYATEEMLELDPLPCWHHLPLEEVRQRVAELVRQIETEAAAEREAAGKRSLGRERIVAVHPHQRPRTLDLSPARDFHAATEKALKELREAYA